MEPTGPLPPSPATHPASTDDPYGAEWVVGPRFIERAQEFRQGFHTEAYLRWRLRMSGLTLARLPDDQATEAIRVSGYSDWTKFSQHLLLWHELARAMPRPYAEFIGVREEILFAAAEQDRADARRALELPSRPDVFGGQYFGPVKFPPQCRDERDCLAHLVAFSRQKGVQTCFTVAGLKMYWVYPGGAKAEVRHYEFRVRYRSKQIEFVREEQVTALPL